MISKRHLTGFALTTVVLVASHGCARSPDVPLDEDTFVEVMVELHLLDARPEPTISYDELRAAILQRYGTRETAVDSTTRYYAEHPDEYSEVYGRIIDRLNERRRPDHPPR